MRLWDRAPRLGEQNAWKFPKFTEPKRMPFERVTPFASTELALKHSRNKLYKELVLQHLVLQLFDDSRKGSTRFVSTGIRSTKIWIYRIKFYKNRFYRK